MKNQSILAAALLFAVAAETQADLTIKGQNSSTDGSTTGFTMYLKDGQMRMDGGDGMSMLIRPTADGSHEFVFLDHGKRQVMLMPRRMADAAERAVSATTDNFVRVVDSEEDPILGYKVLRVEYAVTGSASLPVAEGQEIPPELAGMMSTTMHTRGTSLVAPDADGADELATFYAGIGADTGDVNGMPGLTKGLMAGMLHVVAHGLPLKTETTTETKIAVDAQGPMRAMIAGMMQRMPNQKSTSVSEVQELSTDVVDAALFYGGGLPEGYSVSNLAAP